MHSPISASVLAVPDSPRALDVYMFIPFNWPAQLGRHSALLFYLFALTQISTELVSTAVRAHLAGIDQLFVIFKPTLLFILFSNPVNQWLPGEWRGETRAVNRKTSGILLFAHNMM